MNSFIDFLVPIAILLFQYFLSTRQTNWLGALLPIIYILTIIYFITSGQSDSSFLNFLLFFTGLIALLGVWSKGRNDLKRKQDREITKMKTKDIKSF